MRSRRTRDTSPVRLVTATVVVTVSPIFSPVSFRVTSISIEVG
jgi:hypothetical protein